MKRKGRLYGMLITRSPDQRQGFLFIPQHRPDAVACVRQNAPKQNKKAANPEGGGYATEGCHRALILSKTSTMPNTTRPTKNAIQPATSTVKNATFIVQFFLILLAFLFCRRLKGKLLISHPKAAEMRPQRMIINIVVKLKRKSRNAVAA